MDDAYAVQGMSPVSVPAPGILGNDSDPDGDAQWAQWWSRGLFTGSWPSMVPEVILNFGMNQEWVRGQQEMQVQLTNRIIIILRPFAAKRLALLLSGIMQQYEGLFGTLDLNERPAPTRERVAQSGESNLTSLP